MEFLSANLINTTGSITVTSGTSSAENLLYRDETRQFISDGQNDDTTICSVTISFNQTTAVGRIGLIETNAKQFTAFYNGVTANTFSLTSTGATTVSDFSSNSETSMWLKATQVNCTSVTFDFYSTQVANSEKAVGYIYLGTQTLEFERIPSAKNYKPLIDPTQIKHNMSDGDVRINTIADKRMAKIKLQNITESFRNSLREIHKSREKIGFCAFPTTTGWDEFFMECVWKGPFNAYEVTEDAVASGFNVSIDLAETS